MTKPASPDDIPVVPIIALAVLFVTAGYFLYLFISALVGLAHQLANPTAPYESNATLFVALYPPWLGLAYAFLPELADRRRRLSIASRIALVPTLLLPLVCGVLLPSMTSTAPWPFAATLLLVFAGVGVLPTLALARAYVSAACDTRVAADGDLYVDVEALTGDARRIVAKGTNGTFRRPTALHRPRLIGDSGRLTHRDVIRLIDLETEELDRLAAHADAEARRAMAEFRHKRTELLAAASPELAHWLTERARVSSPVFAPEDE